MLLNAIKRIKLKSIKKKLNIMATGNNSSIFINWIIIITITFKNYLFIYGCAGFSLLHRLFSNCGEWWPLSNCGAQASQCSFFSYCVAQALRCMGFSNYDSRTLGHRLSNWHTGLVAPQHVRSSQIEDKTCVSCIGRWTLTTEP